MIKNALIFGITGQDGQLLSELLLKNGFSVFGITRQNIKGIYNQNNLYLLKQRGIQLIQITSLRQEVIDELIKQIQPVHIYNFSGVSSVSYSYKYPNETFESIVLNSMYILEALRKINPRIKYYNAGSTEIYGNQSEIITETSEISPVSPYGFAKATTINLVKYYRDFFQINAVSGILSNHESPYRKDCFVLKKIITEAVKIKRGDSERLVLGNVNIIRDWGWAPEYMDAIFTMMKMDIKEDIIIASGNSCRLLDIVKITFDLLDLDYKNYLETNSETELRSNEISEVRIDNSKACRLLSWEAKTGITTIIENMLDVELNRQ